MSYTIDVYHRQLPPARSFVDYALYVSFFPQLVAGPIERATRLLPQLQRLRRPTLDELRTGAWLIFWGLFEKVAIADSLAPMVDAIFRRAPEVSGAEVLFAAYGFAIQIFCDFDGYSNMARGLAAWLGVDLMVNFRQPYAASNPVEFWRRWHISLSTWLRDYLYIPLGGNRGGAWRAARTIAITMFLGGLWHGAAWTFVLWGVFHGGLIIGYRGWRVVRERLGLDLFAGRPRLAGGISVLLWFHLVCLGWLLFRATSVEQCLGMVERLLHGLRLADLAVLTPQWGRLAAAVLPLLLLHRAQRRSEDLEINLRWPFAVQWVCYTVLFHLLVILGARPGHQFIYFQF